MNIDINKIFNGMKKLSPALFAIFIATGFIIFSPAFVLEKLGLDTIPQTVKLIIGGLFVISSSLILTIVISEIFMAFKHARYISSLKKQMKDLTEAELIRILIMYHSQAHVLSMQAGDGIAGALMKKHIIIFASELSDGIGFATFQFMLQPWVVNYISKHRNDYPYSVADLQQQYEKHMKSLRY